MPQNNSPGAELGRRLAALTLGKKPGKPKPGGPPADTSGLPKPPPIESAGNLVQEKLPEITQQAVGEEGARAGLMGEKVGATEQSIKDSMAESERMGKELGYTSFEQEQKNQHDISIQRQELDRLPAQVKAEASAALDSFKDYADKNIAAQTDFANKTMAEVGRGQSMAMESAVQGAQGIINNQISQISSDPSIPPSQKQAMINQVKMQGAMTVGPIIGSTILEFNKLHADTAVSFGNQISNLRGQAVQGAATIGESGMRMTADAFRATAEIGSQLTQLSVNDRHQYVNERTQIATSRWQAQQTGNQTLMALLPEYESTIPLYSDIYADELATNVQAIQMDNSLNMGMWGMQLTSVQAQLAAMNARWNSLQSAVSGIPVIGPIASAAVGVMGAFQPTPAPQPGFNYA